MKVLLAILLIILFQSSLITLVNGANQVNDGIYNYDQITYRCNQITYRCDQLFPDYNILFGYSVKLVNTNNEYYFFVDNIGCKLQDYDDYLYYNLTVTNACKNTDKYNIINVDYTDHTLVDIVIRTKSNVSINYKSNDYGVIGYIKSMEPLQKEYLNTVYFTQQANSPSCFASCFTTDMPYFSSITVHHNC